MYTIIFTFVDDEYGLNVILPVEKFPFVPSIGQSIEIFAPMDDDCEYDEYSGIVSKVKIKLNYHENDYEEYGCKVDEYGRVFEYHVEVVGYASPIHDLVENKPDYIDTLVTKKDL